MEVVGGNRKKSPKQKKGVQMNQQINKSTNKDVPKSASPKLPTAMGTDCTEGMTAAELIMVRRLAGNDAVIRRKTLRKLRKWLTVLSQKVPDAPESRMMIESNFIRVWKALFYCMWMADKPLPQEQLADSISEMQNIFASKTAPFLLFVEWFIRTMAREWSWIDRFRIDKFMMLFRRFLRKTLIVIADRKWQNDILEGYMKVIGVFIFNRHPATKTKKHQQFGSPTMAPLGLQIHFTDIFMEELAKVGGSSLKSQKILKVLTVFISELGQSNDDRLLGEIRERIFNHLMRQSDVGMDYVEDMAGGGAQEEVNGEEDNDEEEKLGDEDQYLEDEAGDDPMSTGILDPRAGAVDVILPQLDIDYTMVYKKLIEFGGRKEIKLKNRRILYSIASQFKELTDGSYPLALPKDEGNIPAIPRKQVNKAAKELVESELLETTGKRRKTKKERKRDAKKARNASVDSIGSEDGSQYIQDEELLDHVSDNYMSYLEDEIKINSEETETADDDNVDGVEKVEDQGNEIVEKKTKKGRKRKYKTIVEVEADEVSVEDQVTASVTDDKKDNEDTPNKEEIVVVKRPKLTKRASLGNNNTIAANTPLRGKVPRVSELRTPSNIKSPLNSSITTSANKRVSFVLARNMEHDHSDYPESIARSPSIPYDKNRQPGLGLLKSPLTTPKSTPIRRAAALDFF